MGLGCVERARENHSRHGKRNVNTVLGNASRSAAGLRRGQGCAKGDL